MHSNINFWLILDRLVAGSEITIDRPKGSLHPRYPDTQYPLDYGYLEETRSGDGAGVDVWVGSLREGGVTGAIVSVDVEKRDLEVKVLLGCTPEEMWVALAFHNNGGQAAALLQRVEEKE